ncbi:discoidin domain-containing protein [Streptomyces sp. NPDC014724]|uniref:discoidin domain-containing protein n=1 Tax=unclassified Streptomyces TaxID=2593676 RepID=UPI0036F66831
MNYEHEDKGRPGRRSVLAGAVAVAAMAAASSAPGWAATAKRPGAVPAGPATEAERWAALRTKLSGFTAEWSDQEYSGSVTDGMPKTALLGNGDVGVTSGGSTGVKTFHISKGDFWTAHPEPRPLPVGGVTVKAAAHAGDTDLASGATATASSVHNSFTPDRAVNGAWGAGYEGWVSAVGKPQWIALDLGEQRTVARYVVRNDSAARPGNEANDAKDLRLQSSTDGTAWTDVDTVTGNTAAVVDRDLAAPLTSRYLRLHITEPTQGTTTDSVQNPRARIGQIELYAAPKGDTPDPGAFHEAQHILDARITTSVVMAGVPLDMETWLSADENTLVTTVTSRGAGDVELAVQTWAGAAGGGSGYPATAGADSGTAWARRSTAEGGAWVSHAALATRVLGAAAVGAPTVSGATATTGFTLAARSTATIVTCIAGGGRNPAGVESAAVAAVAAQSLSGVAQTQARHLDWWKRYWLASGVDLGRPVLERYYYAAQYFIGAASRPGRIAPGLYGIWTTTDQAMWHGDYHLNYNAMAPFYGVYSSNRPELALPFHDAMLAYVPEARRRAQQDLRRVNSDYVAQRFPSGGVPDGLLFPVGIGPYGSTTDDTYWQQVGNSLFAASQFCAYYAHTQDVDFLRDKAFPFLKLVAEFFRHWLEWDPATQRYALWSGPHEGTWGKNSSPDLGMLKQTLSTLIDASHVLGTDPQKRVRWQNILDHLPAQPTTTYRGATVYALAEPGSMQGDTRDIRPGDNTVNLEFIHPGEILGITSSDQERRIAVDTIDVMNSWRQMNSFPKVFTQAARVGYSASPLIQHLEDVVKQSTAANLRIDDHYHGIEKSGATEAINSMLAQSFGGVVVVFPVWPTDQDAAFDRLLLPGAFETSAALRGGTVRYVQVTSRAGGSLRLRSPWPRKKTVVTDGRGKHVGHTVDDNGVITVPTTRGRTYLLRPATK